MKNICKTPGMKIRSKGMGQGLARGGGRGPIGVPLGRKTSFGGVAPWRGFNSPVRLKW
jgi:hypothetical protein